MFLVTLCSESFPPLTEATSSSSRYSTRSVCSMIALASLAKKYSTSPRFCNK